MAFPAAGLSSAWRNHIDDVANMLNKYHKNHYMIWNLSDKQYDYSKFDDNVCCVLATFKNKQTNLHRSLNLVFLTTTLRLWICCLKLYSPCIIGWKLTLRTSQLCIVWCVAEFFPFYFAYLLRKGGKGRTGTVICCYLYFIGLFQDSSEAMEYFAQKRSKIENGVRQPSQRRLVCIFVLLISTNVF